MAVGFSGSNGGIAGVCSHFPGADSQAATLGKECLYPTEISYFVNNTCNLRCSHCYVAYRRVEHPLSTQVWLAGFDDLIKIGARIFGNVGKEPLLSWRKTAALLVHLKRWRERIPQVRFGLVTNGTLLDDEKIHGLAELQPDYIDVSLDGDEQAHDAIRGAGTFARTMGNLRRVGRTDLIRKVFASFTMNRLNVDTVGALVEAAYPLGIRNLLVSPYVTVRDEDVLRVQDEEILAWVSRLLDGQVIDFRRFPGLNVYVKNDYSTTRPLMEEFVRQGLIDLDALLIDSYGVVFCQHRREQCRIYFNYQPFDPFPTRAIRISHDGYVSDCLSMFYDDYPARAIGNVRERPIREILADVAVSAPA